MTGDEIHLYEVPVTNLLPFRCSAEPRDLTRCAAVQYNIALVLCLHREASQRESYSDAQHRKILYQVTRYEYFVPAEPCPLGQRMFMCLHITHTSIRKPTSQWPTSFLYYRATTTSSRRNAVLKLRQQATPGYIPFSLYIFMCYTPTSHTTESKYRRRNFSPRNCQAFPIKTTRH